MLVVARRTNHLLLTRSRLACWREGPSTLIVQCGPFLLSACFFGTICGALVACALLAVGLACEMISRSMIAASIASMMAASFAVVLALWTLLAAITAALATLQAAFPRRWEFHPQSKMCILRNIPGFDRHLAFNRIGHVELVVTRTQGGAWVVLSLRDSHRPFLVCGVKPLREPWDSIIQALTTVANEMSSVLNVQVRRREASTLFVYMIRWW